MRQYLRFAAMVATSTIVMFGLMYLNTYELADVFLYPSGEVILSRV